MPFTERDSQKENSILKELVESDPDANKQIQQLKQLYTMRKMLIMLRQKQKMTQKDLSLKTGLSQQQISRVETGNCNILTLLKYLDGLNIDISFRARP